MAIFNVDNIDTADAYYMLQNSTNTTLIHITSNHAEISNFALDVFQNLVALNINLYGIIDLDKWVWISNGPPIVGCDVWDVTGQNAEFLNTAKFVCAFSYIDSMKIKSTLGIINNSEKFFSLFYGNDI